MDLKRYVSDVECLEKEKYAFECIIGSIDKKIRELEKPCVVYKKGNPVSHDEMSISSTQWGVIIASIILIIIGLSTYGNNPDSVGFWVSAIMFWLPSLLMLGGVIIYIKGAKQEHEINEAIIEREYQQQVQDARNQEQIKRQMATYYRQARNKLYTTYEKTCKLLHQMYAKGIIAEEYRYDMVAICTFSQYLRSRKCFTLEGHEGAYLLYEEEKFRGMVLGKLDEIITYLDRIEQNQYGIAMALREINNTQNRILNNLQVISQRQEQQLENTEYMRYDLEVLKTNSDIAMIYGLRYV